MLLREKDSTFIQETRIEGNLSVVTHPNDHSFYGDGSIEVGGILRTDGIMSATPNTVIHMGSPLNFHVKILNHNFQSPVKHRYILMLIFQEDL